MTKRTVSKKKTATKPSHAPAGKQADPPPAAAPKPAEPTFTLAEFSRAFGQNYGGDAHADDPTYFALNALDDIKRHLYLLTLALNDPGGDDGSAAEDVLTQVWFRTGAAIDVLNKFRIAGKTTNGGAA